MSAFSEMKTQGADILIRKQFSGIVYQFINNGYNQDVGNFANLQLN